MRSTRRTCSRAAASADRRAVIRDREHGVGARRRSRGQRHRQHVALVRERDLLAAARNAGHGHAGPADSARGIERDLVDAVLREAQIDGRVAADLGGVLFQFEAKDVVPGVDTGLSRVGDRRA